MWHFKEGPFICLEKGLWPELVELTTRADGTIHSSPEQRDWFETVLPGITTGAPTLVLDGDLPKRDWFVGERSPRLSDADGEIHTVVPGTAHRPACPYRRRTCGRGRASALLR